MNNLKRTLAVLLVFALTLSCFIIPAAAAETQWNGTTKLESGKSYIVTSAVKITAPVEIPSGASLTIAEGGSLLIYAGGAVNVSGTLTVNTGASVTNSGTVNINEGGVIHNKGQFLSTLSGLLSVKGNFNNFKGAEVRSSSEMLVYGGGKITNTGVFYILKSGKMTLSGEISNTVSGDFHIQGKLLVTLNGEMRSSGYVTVGKNGLLKISGKVWLKTGSGFTRFGKVTLTINGTFIDHSNKVSNEKLTVNLLTDKAEEQFKGIDVSYAQGDIDWAMVASSGIDFAIIRAGRGDTGSGCKSDDYFETNIKGAISNGLDVGVYFYSYATTVDEAKTEAEFLVKLIKDYNINYPVILDMEEEITDQDVTAMIDAFFSVIMDAGYYPMFYSYKSWIEENLDMRILDKYAVWLAQTEVSAPTYEGGFYIWQYSHKGKVSGISTDVDLNISYRNFPSIFAQYRINNLK